MAKEFKTEKRMIQVEVEVPTVETTDRGPFDDLFGKKVLFMCMNYFYTGTLVTANDTYVELSEPKIVYETGEWSKSTWTDAQSLPSKTIRLSRNAIESWCEVSK